MTTLLPCPRPTCTASSHHWHRYDGCAVQCPTAPNCNDPGPRDNNDGNDGNDVGCYGPRDDGGDLPHRPAVPVTDWQPIDPDRIKPGQRVRFDDPDRYACEFIVGAPVLHGGTHVESAHGIIYGFGVEGRVWSVDPDTLGDDPDDPALAAAVEWLRAETGRDDVTESAARLLDRIDAARQAAA